MSNDGEAELLLLTLLVRCRCLDTVIEAGVRAGHFGVPAHRQAFLRLVDYCGMADHPALAPTEAEFAGWFPWYSPAPVPAGTTVVTAAHAVVMNSLRRAASSTAFDLLSNNSAVVQDVENTIQDLKRILAGHVIGNVGDPVDHVAVAQGRVPGDVAGAEGTADATAPSGTQPQESADPATTGTRAPRRTPTPASARKRYRTPIDKVLDDLANGRPWSWFISGYCGQSGGRPRGGEAELASLIADETFPVEHRSALLLGLLEMPSALAVLAMTANRAPARRRTVQVAPDVLREYLRAPVKAACLGRWLSRRGIALDCRGIADEHAGVVIRRLRCHLESGRADGWDAWLRWMTDAADACAPDRSLAFEEGQSP